MKKGILFRCRKTAAVVMAFAMTLSYLPQQGISAYAKDGSVASQSQVTVSSRECSGWYESAYVEWQPVDGAKSYNVYIKGETEADSAYKKLDDELIRQYPDYWRADAPGLKAGKYMFKVEAVTDSTTASMVTPAVEVMSYDRSGYGFVNGTSSGAYNEDGTLKDNAVVLYITENTKDTVSLDVVTGSKGEVTSYTGLQAILYGFKKGKDSRPLDVRLVGNITDLKSMDKGDIVIDGCKNGITFEGIGEDATANGWGLRVKGSSNIEIRNLAYMNCDSNEGDDVGLQQDNDHVWVHNCDFFYGHAGSDADQKKGDGALDTKKSTYVTHSYNHFYDTGKSNLQGMKSETTSNYITYHHNWYDHADSRCPRIRTCTVHVYNNYYDGNSKYGIGATMGSSVFSENNYYRNCKFPMLMAGQGSDTKYAETVKGIFSGENGGVIKAYGNHIEGAKAAVTYQKDAAGFDFYEASSRDEVIDCSALKGGSKYSNFDTAADFYKYSVQSAEDAKDTVIKYAGRMNGGDFKWTFDNSVDDESYAVNEPLKAKLMSYKTTLVSVGGSVSGTDRPGTGETPGTGEDKPGTGEDKPGTGEDKPGTGEDKPGTGEDKPSTGETAASAVHNFTTDYTTADSFFTISGNLADKKGTNKYNGLSLTKCLKIESSTSVTFKATSKGKLVLVTEASKKIKIDGKAVQADADGVISMDVEAGEHKIAKKDATILFYISFTGDGSQTPGMGEDKPGTGEDKPGTGEDKPGTGEDKPGTGEDKPSTGGDTDKGDKPGERVDNEVREHAPGFKDGDIYVSAKGSSEGDGSYEKPMDFVTALNTVKPGNTIWMFSATYYVYDMYKAPVIISEDNSGTADAYKTVSSINGKPVTINFDGMAEEGSNRGITLDGSYWHFYDIDICNAGDNGMLLSGDHNVIERCRFYANHDSGLQISRYNTSYNSIEQWPSYNTILNCTAYDNKDIKTCENADGFAAKLTCGEGNVFDGCISYCNSDDGWDLYAKPATGPIGVVTIKNCIAFGNGKLTDGSGSANGDMNGFKLGGSNGACPTPHVVENCLAFNNGATGFTDNGNGGAIKMSNCIAVNNGMYDTTKANFMCYRTSEDAEYTNIVSAAASKNAATDQFKGKLSHVLYNYKGVGTYWVNEWTCKDGAKTKYTGSEVKDYTVALSDFVNTTIPGYNASNGSYAADYHEVFRNADGSINVNQLYELKSDSRIYEAGVNGSKIGCSFEKVEIPAPEPTPDKQDEVKVLNRTLNVGMSGEDVKEVQQYLKNLGYLDSVVDGSYGNVTKAAAIMFQANESLYVDGEIGNASYKVMQQTSNKFSVLKKGMSGNAVKVMQTYLIKLGYLGGVADGGFGAVTEAAVKKFQSVNGLYADGEAGIKTLSVLYGASPKSNTNNTVKSLDRTLKVGCTGSDVKEVQQCLKNLGYLDSVVDGSYGNATKVAAMIFQANESLYVDGEIGNVSYKVMQQTTKKFTTLKKGISGNAVKVMQTYLIKLGYLGGVADGNFGAVTEAAVKKFQKDNGLYADGEAGIKTLSVLYKK